MVMTAAESIEQSYLALFKFLLLSKHRVFELGSKYGLSGMQTMLLCLLDSPRPMNNFRKVFNCDASNITGIVDGLEHKQLVKRFEDANDRRLKMVKLEPKGQRLRGELMKSLTTANSPLLSKLTRIELKTFIQLLEKITKGASIV
jgi:DNA-binding MarR family transcriptional regulator